jgi:natural product precursor
MLKTVLNLEGVQKLSTSELKSLMGGQPIPPSNCRCFCYNGITRYSASCFTYCADGSIPGLSEGSTGNCQFPFPPQPEL